MLNTLCYGEMNNWIDMIFYGEVVISKLWCQMPDSQLKWQTQCPNYEASVSVQVVAPDSQTVRREFYLQLDRDNTRK